MRSGIPFVCRLASPLHSNRLVLGDAPAFSVHDSQITPGHALVLFVAREEQTRRLGRNPSQTLKILEDFTENKVSIYSRNFGLETLTPTKKLNPAASLIFTVYAEVARMEREQLRERILSGLENAKRKGKTLGRRAGSGESNESFLKKYAASIRRIKEGHSLRNTCLITGISINTARKLKALIST